ARNLFWALSDAMTRNPEPARAGTVLPNAEAASAYQALAPEVYPQLRTLIAETVASGLVYMNSHAVDFQTPELRPYLDRYLRGSGGYDALGRVKVMKLLWDAIGSEFGSRHELYEINYAGSVEEVRRIALFG